MWHLRNTDIQISYTNIHDVGNKTFKNFVVIGTSERICDPGDISTYKHPSPRLGIVVRIFDPDELRYHEHTIFKSQWSVAKKTWLFGLRHESININEIEERCMHLIDIAFDSSVVFRENNVYYIIDIQEFIMLNHLTMKHLLETTDVDERNL